MFDWLQNQKFSAILAVLGFLLVIASFFEVSDITKLAITPSSNPLSPVFILGVTLLGVSVWLFYLDTKSVGFELPKELDTKPKLIKKSVFISAPMNMFVVSGRPGDYKQSRQEILKIIAEMRRCCGIQDIFYAGENIENIEDFDLPETSLKDDFRLIQQREYFVLFWPNKFASRSALIEAGIALTLNKKFICFVRKYEDLPFLLQGAQNVTRNIKIIKYMDTDELVRVVCHSQSRIFDFSKLS